MKPIQSLPQEKPKLVKNEVELIQGYELDSFYNFMPEWLEDIYTGSNKQHLQNSNIAMQDLAYKKQEYIYIASIKYKNSIVEYYYDSNYNILSYLINIVKNNRNIYYNLVTIAVYKRNEGNNKVC